MLPVAKIQPISEDLWTDLWKERGIPALFEIGIEAVEVVGL
jgi:hypothetical protein